MSQLLSSTSKNPSIALEKSSSISGEISGLASGFGTIIRKRNIYVDIRLFACETWEDITARNFPMLIIAVYRIEL